MFRWLLIVVIVADAVVVVSVVVVELLRLGARGGERLATAFVVFMKPPVGTCGESHNSEALCISQKKPVRVEKRCCVPLKKCLYAVRIIGRRLVKRS